MRLKAKVLSLFVIFSCSAYAILSDQGYTEGQVLSFDRDKVQLKVREKKVFVPRSSITEKKLKEGQWVIARLPSPQQKPKKGR
ncbi:MAG: hypothetical protein AB7F43_03355 [Bacteriovoracia bacterium]